MSLFLEPKQTLVFHKVSQQHPETRLGLPCFSQPNLRVLLMLLEKLKVETHSLYVGTKKTPKIKPMAIARIWQKLNKNTQVPSNSQNLCTELAMRNSRAAQFMANCFLSPKHKPRPSFHPFPQHFCSAGDLYNHTTSLFLGNSG